MRGEIHSRRAAGLIACGLGILAMPAMAQDGDALAAVLILDAADDFLFGERQAASCRQDFGRVEAGHHLV